MVKTYIISALRRLRLREFRAILSYILHYPIPLLRVQVLYLLPVSNSPSLGPGRGVHSQHLLHAAPALT